MLPNILTFGELGRDLLNKCFRHSKINGLEKVELEVYGTNKASIVLYKKIGFEIVGAREKLRKIDNHYDSCVFQPLLFAQSPL